MRYRVLGKTGLTVSEVGFGAWAIGGDAWKGYGPTNDAVSLAALNRAYELGCTFFDTADVYGLGNSETLIGQALKGWERDRVVIATKVGYEFDGERQKFLGRKFLPGPDTIRQVFSEKHIRAAVEASLKRLGIDCIDVYQLHNPSLELIQLGKLFEVMQALASEGKIRHCGISIHDPQEGIQAIRVGSVDTVQAIYNLFDRRVEQGLLSACAGSNTGLIIREPFARGFLTGKMTPEREFAPGDNRAVWPKPLIAKRIQAAEALKEAVPEGYPNLGALALKLALDSDAVSVVIPGCKTPAQVEENMAVSDLPDLDEPDRQRVQAALGRVF